MGVYIYNMRKKTVSIIVNGSAVNANLFSYAYKDSWAFKLGREAARWEFKVANTERIGQEAFDSPRSGYVVVGDAKDDHHGASVYNNVTQGLWVDTFAFPGTIVGYLHREGKRLVLRSASPWNTWKVMNEDTGEYEPQEVRYVVQPDGKVTSERRKPKMDYVPLMS